MLRINNVRVMDPESRRDESADILLDGGRIVRIAPGVPDPADTEIDGTGLVAAPGFIDAHVHFRDPGQTRKEDLATGSRAALRGGYTTVVCMANTTPPIDCPSALRDVLRRARGMPVRILQAAAVTKGLLGAELTDFAALREAGAAFFTDDGRPLADSGLLREAFRRAAALDVLISLHEEDPALVASAGSNRGAPPEAEDSLVARDCMLALHTGARVHIQHISSAGAVALVRFAKRLGARVTAEATPHHFTFSEDDLPRLGACGKMNPPLRTRADREQILAGLADGAIDIIATDHAPHTAAEKAKPFGEAPSGVIGLETAFAAGMTQLVRTGRLTLMGLIAKMSLQPARLLGLSGSGALREGGRADIVLLDPDEAWRADAFASKSSNSPYLHDTLYGRVRYTVCGGVPHGPFGGLPGGPGNGD